MRVLPLIPASVAIGLLAAASSCDQPTINSAPASSGLSSAAAQTSKVAKVGDSVVVGGNNDGEQLTVQLVAIVDPAQGADQFTLPDAGKHFVSIQFRLVNSGRIAYSDAPDNDARVLDAQGQSFSPDFSTTTAGPEFAGNEVNIAKGASELGFITFQVPNGDKVAKAQFTTDSGFGQTAQWSVP